MTRTDKDFLKVSLIGFGTVGRGLAKVLYGGTGAGRRGIKIVSITDRSGTVYNPDGLDLSRAVLVKQSSGRIFDYGGKFAHDWDSFAAIEKCGSDVVVEVTPTNIETAEPALSHIKHAFKHGRHVVSANKGPFALFFEDVASLAAKNSKHLFYGASVCGAIPIIELCRDLLIGNEVYEVSGIFNGSSNYIISRMEESGIGFDDALAEAMTKGITEQNPSQDIDGWDAAAKLVILADSVMNSGLTIHDVAVSGIRGLSQKEIGEALKRGKKIRLIGRISRSTAKVSLEEVDAGSPMAIGSTLNIAVVTTDLAKDITVIGRGAGEFETASAVLSDLNTIKNRLFKDSPAINGSKFGSLKSG
ncbi:MAG: homoserine dehydrogenase, partial [Deltaproteobacteria bacterium]|nr:homoserine dehydrogenase [Deltaproteobacteria bacterium]